MPMPDTSTLDARSIFAALGACDPKRARMLTLKMFCIVAGSATVAWFVRVMMARDAGNFHWWAQILLSLVAILSCALLLEWQWRHWHRPYLQLKDLLSKARQGKVPIEELSRVGGAFSDVAPMLQELLRELREAQAKNNELNDEIRQRVVQRTDKLERQIGVLKHQATKDSLTGLLNRRAMEEMLPSMIEQRREQGWKFCLLMIDVDHFKSLNDTLGHAAGDEFLKSLGQLIRSTLRPSDVAFRVGGDEMIIVLPDATRDAGEALCSRLGSLVDGLAKTLKVTPKPRLSIGLVTLMDVKEANAASVLGEADKRLYEVKASKPGRVARKAG